MFFCISDVKNCQFRCISWKLGKKKNGIAWFSFFSCKISSPGCGLKLRSWINIESLAPPKKTNFQPTNFTQLPKTKKEKMMFFCFGKWLVSWLKNTHTHTHSLLEILDSWKKNHLHQSTRFARKFCPRLWLFSMTFPARSSKAWTFAHPSRKETGGGEGSVAQLLGEKIRDPMDVFFRGKTFFGKWSRCLVKYFLQIWLLIFCYTLLYIVIPDEGYQDAPWNPKLQISSKIDPYQQVLRIPSPEPWLG